MIPISPALILLILQEAPTVIGILEKLVPAIQSAVAAGAPPSSAAAVVAASVASHVDTTDWAAAVRGFPDG